MLAYQWHQTHGVPVVFLHGLLGSQQDWAAVFAQLHRLPKNVPIRPLAVDLPCHGNSTATCQSFADCRQQLQQLITEQIDQPFFLVGYSLGGRVALDYLFHTPSPPLLGVLLEGANVGLPTHTERQARWQADVAWANRFRQEPLAEVLADWYRQPVFADLSASKRSAFIQKRQHNRGERIAQMLEATSLAKQPFFDCHAHPKLHFLIGEHDQKCRQMAAQYQLRHQLIANAGHNAHQQNPLAFAQAVVDFIERKQNGSSALPRVSP